MRIPGYRIEKLLGKGGMATVYLATQTSLGRPVALKILNDPETPQFFERFFFEGRCVARLSHSSLVTIYDIGQGEGFYYIAMEYLPGGDLKSQIAQGLKPAQVLKLLSRLASCLGYVHGKGVIHRDLKPSNIMFRADGMPVLTDFGIAKLIQAENDLTVTGTVMGSPHYLSPEQAQGSRKLDGRSDLYSLGIILFELLTGRKPYTADSFAATLMAHIRQPIPRLPDEFAPLQPLLDRLLAKEPEKRFQNGAELARELRRLRNAWRHNDQAQTPAPPNGRWRQLPSRLLRYTPVILIAAVAIMLINPFNGSETPPAPVAEYAPAAESTPPPRQTSENAYINPPLSEPVTTAIPPPSDIPEEPTASSEVATPPTTTPTPLDEIDSWLQTAQQRLADNKLSFPRGDSARDYYLRVLEREPANEQASLGLDRIADRYRRLAQGQIARDNRQRALQFVEHGLKIRPEDQLLLDLAQQLQQAPPATTIEPPLPVYRPQPIQPVSPDPFKGLVPEGH